MKDFINEQLSYQTFMLVLHILILLTDRTFVKICVRKVGVSYVYHVYCLPLKVAKIVCTFQINR